MAYRRERNIRDMYEERFIQERAGQQYPRGGGGERRPPFGRPEEEYGRGGFEYESGGGRFYPNGGGPPGGGPPRNFHGEEQRGYHGDGMHFPPDRRNAPPPARRDEPFAYRGPPREEPPRPEFRGGSRAAPPPPGRGQIYATPRALPATVPEVGDDTLMQAILNLDRGEERDPAYRRKGPFPPPPRERSPVRRDVPPSPHSRSGSSVSSRGYSPDRAKGLAYPPQTKSVDPPEKQLGPADLLWGSIYAPQAGLDTLDKDRIPGLSDRIPGLSDGSPQSTTSISKEESHVLEGDKEETLVIPPEEGQKVVDDFQERRAQVIATKAREIEKVYRQDCETFGMVVKMLVAKDSGLEKQLQMPLKENLGEIRERCLDDLKHFIHELDEAVREEPPSPSV